MRSLLASSVAAVLVAAGAAAGPTLVAGCGDDTNTNTNPTGTSSNTCDVEALSLETGDPDGHADPFGAKAANQARAGRIKSAASVPQPAHGRQKIEDGDFVLANDKIAVFIEDKDVSDGYGRFGGEVIAVDRVGADGKPLGQSKFLETLQLTSLYMINPDSVSVLNDGSNNEAAVVRVRGPLEPLPFLADTFGAAFPTQYAGLVAAYDFTLEPGAEKLSVRFGFINPTDYQVDTGVDFNGSWNLFGFFQRSQNELFLPGLGFADPTGTPDWIGYINDAVPFAYQGPDGSPLEFGGIDISGFQAFAGTGIIVDACSVSMFEDHQIVVGEPGGGVDGLGEVVRRVNAQPAWHAVTGILTEEGSNAPIAGAYVHVLAADGSYLTRVTTDDNGNYTVHVPDEAVTFIPSRRGFPTSSGVDVVASDTQVDLTLPQAGRIHVSATELNVARNIPVRVQVIPTDPVPETPAAYGDVDEVNGRLWQYFAVSGDVTLEVPPGEHRVIVSRGYEWELSDQTLSVGAGELVQHPVVLEHSVDTTGAMSADFHIHSMYSADSSDPVLKKVRSALADGLDMPISSEHEWIISFQPIIESLGAQDFAFGAPSEELTTFTWGHFGVVPIQPRPDQLNNGAIDWLGKAPSDVFAEVHALPEKPALIVNHPSGSATFQAYFRAAGFDPDTGTSDDPLWSEDFDAIEVFNDSDFDANRDASVAHWFSLLNHGKTYFAVGSSDSHSVRSSPVGYPRTFLQLGYDDPKLANADDIRDAIKQGAAVVSGGLYMTVEGPNSSTPGSTQPKTATADFTVTVQCPSWLSADTLEVIVNGDTVDTIDLMPSGAGTAKTYVNQVTVNLPSGARDWVVFHAKGTGDLAPLHPGRAAFAVSNPIFFQ
ncbi:MAG: CehA/McbA family metallohydrolase [Polyangiaceae bacterium]